MYIAAGTRLSVEVLLVFTKRVTFDFLILMRTFINKKFELHELFFLILSP
jgi:hypothetical protein